MRLKDPLKKDVPFFPKAYKDTKYILTNNSRIIKYKQTNIIWLQMYPYVCMYINTLQKIFAFSLMKNILLHHSLCASSSSAKPMDISVFLLTSACVHFFPFSP